MIVLIIVIIDRDNNYNINNKFNNISINIRDNSNY